MVEKTTKKKRAAVASSSVGLAMYSEVEQSEEAVVVVVARCRVLSFYCNIDCVSRLQQQQQQKEKNNMNAIIRDDDETHDDGWLVSLLSLLTLWVAALVLNDVMC